MDSSLGAVMMFAAQIALHKHLNPLYGNERLRPRAEMQTKARPEFAVENQSVALILASRRELRRRGLHMVAAMSANLDLQGALLKPSGVPACLFTGAAAPEIGADCIAVEGCDRSGVICP